MQNRKRDANCAILGDGIVYGGHHFNITQEADNSAAGFQWVVAEEGAQAREAKRRKLKEKERAEEARRVIRGIFESISRDVCEYDSPNVLRAVVELHDALALEGVGQQVQCIRNLEAAVRECKEWHGSDDETERASEG